MADAGVGETAVAGEAAKGAGEAAAAGEAAGAGYGAAELGGAAAAGEAAGAGIGAGVGAGAAGAAAPAAGYASVLGPSAADASLYAVPSAGGFAGASLADLGAASAALGTEGAAGAGGAGVAPGYGGPGTEGAGAAGEGAATSGPTGPAAVSPTGVAPGEASTLPAPADVTSPAGAAAQQTGAATSAPAYGGPGTSGAGAAGEGATAGGAAPQQSVVDRALSALGRNPLQAAQVGLGAAGLGMQLNGRNSAQGQYNKVAAGTKQASDALLKQFQSGQLNAADSYKIAQWANHAKASVDSYYQKAGLSNSSMHTDAVNQINAQADAMRQQALDNILQQGLRAAGISDPTLVAGIQAGIKQDDQTMNAMQNFIAQLAKMNTPAAPTGTAG